MTDPDPKHTNRLANETSPYLLQHAHNPVDWFPWGTEALERARADWMSRSDTVSRADVASSRMRMRGSFRRTRAIATRCFSPPDSLMPRSPTIVS